MRGLLDQTDILIDWHLYGIPLARSNPENQSSVRYWPKKAPKISPFPIQSLF